MATVKHEKKNNKLNFLCVSRIINSVLEDRGDFHFTGEAIKVPRGKQLAHLHTASDGKRSKLGSGISTP